MRRSSSKWRRTVDDIIAKYAISSRSVLRSWIKVYNANREFKDYNPKRRSIWQRHEEKQHLRNEKKSLIIASTIIVTIRIQLQNSMFLTVVYSWVKKYDSDGESGLTDRRGQRKTDDEVDELERLRRENLRLKRQLEEKDMVVELLKKVKDFERM